MKLKDIVYILYNKLNEMDSKLEEVDGGCITDLGEISSNSTKDTTVTFNRTFSEPPNVVACLESSSTGYGMGRISVSVLSITKTGCKVRVYNADTSTRSPYIQWIAIAK